MKCFDATISISMDDLADLLCSGMEGGIGYWAEIVDYREPSDLNLKEYFSKSWRTDRVFKHIHYPLLPGGVVMIRDAEGDDKEIYRLDFEAVQRGVKVMANNWPRHFADFMGGNSDATTGDVFIQCALFGDIVYG